MKLDDTDLIALLVMLALVAIGLISWAIDRERNSQDLRRYRPTHDNRFPNRDEFRAMKDWK